MKSERSFQVKLCNAFAGVLSAVRSERNMKIHIAAAIVTVGLAVFLRLALWKWAVLILTIALVTVTEMVNTAIETVIDLYSKDYHPQAKKAKDTAAGAVLTAAFWAVIIGGLIFFS